MIVILKIVQKEAFCEEIKSIQKGHHVSKNSQLFNLNPFLDNQSVLRVGGRIEEATHLSYDQRFPMILPKNHHVTRLIILDTHCKLLHGPLQMVLANIKLKYYIIRCKSTVKYILNNCVKCYRYRCQNQSQQMAKLPKPRVTPSRPFMNCGVDYAGPFTIKLWKGRCNKFDKAYVSLFICFSTKAIHIELVTDLSAAAFVAAYRRFISRRGICSNLYSDCGTNFKGALKTFQSDNRHYVQDWNESIQENLSSIGTKWHFNPPASPHFGGLWEAGVKSVKYHLKRVVGDARLTFEEFNTILTQIEACLNSMPLCQLSDDHTTILTPAHFLIGESLIAAPQKKCSDSNFNYLDRWNYMQKLIQDFWKVWSEEYLTQLQQRRKWQREANNLSINDLVLVKDKGLPPTNWMLARVLQVHPGSDGLVRVATIKTKENVLQRPIVKLCPLPILQHSSTH